jgi:hypothetical protein
MVMTDLSTVRCWDKKCKDGKPGRANLCVKERSGQPATATSEFHKKKVGELIKEDQRITQRVTAVKFGILQ